ncbi:MAG: hypothetical protein WC791_01340 [Candidatus Paceibacterota bacterium]|jgi:hypothetical protein
MAGRKEKSVSGSDLAHPHDVGVTVTFNQIVIHPTYGTILLPVYDHTDFYFKSAESALIEAKKYHEKILSSPVNKSNCRVVYSESTDLPAFFMFSQNVVIYSYLALEYFAISCAQSVNKVKEWEKRRLDQKLKYLIQQELGIPHLSPDLCSAFGELENRRHSLNHPTIKNITNGHPTEWDSAHLAWLMVGNYEKVYLSAKKIYEEIRKPLIEYNKKKPQGEVTLTGVKRGIKFENPAKKSL